MPTTTLHPRNVVYDVAHGEKPEFISGNYYNGHRESDEHYKARRKAERAEAKAKVKPVRITKVSKPARDAEAKAKRLAARKDERELAKIAEMLAFYETPTTLQSLQAREAEAAMQAKELATRKPRRKDTAALVFDSFSGKPVAL